MNESSISYFLFLFYKSIVFFYKLKLYLIGDRESEFIWSFERVAFIFLCAIFIHKMQTHRFYQNAITYFQNKLKTRI